MPQIAEIFHSSLMRGLAENAEKEKYQQEFAYRDERARVEDAFKQLQYQELLKQGTEANADRDATRNLTQMANAYKEYSKFDPTAPYAHLVGKDEGISGKAMREFAGPLATSIKDDEVYVPASTIQMAQYGLMNERAQITADAKAKALADKENASNDQYNGLLSRLYNVPTLTADTKQVADPLKTWYDPTVMFPANRTNPDTGQKERAAWFGLGKKIETGQTFHTEYSANPQSVATRADTLASVFTDINRFTGTKDGKLYAGQLKTSAFNELVDLAYQNQGQNIPYGKQAGTVINQLMPFVKSGIEDFRIKAQKEISIAESKAMSAKDDQTKADALAIVEEWKKRLEDPLYGLDHVKTLYMNQYLKKGN